MLVVEQSQCCIHLWSQKVDMHCAWGQRTPDLAVERKESRHSDADMPESPVGDNSVPLNEGACPPISLKDHIRIVVEYLSPSPLFR